jgi:hypothetical protein
MGTTLVKTPPLALWKSFVFENKIKNSINWKLSQISKVLIYKKIGSIFINPFQHYGKTSVLQLGLELGLSCNFEL